jgi:hypothetical protein
MAIMLNGIRRLNGCSSVSSRAGAWSLLSSVRNIMVDRELNGNLGSWYSLARRKSSSSSTAQTDISKMRLFVLPPIGSSAVITKLHIDVGKEVKSYDLCCEVVATGVTHEGPTEQTNMLVEIVEDYMTVRRIYCNVGDVLKPGDPIALLSEEAADVKGTQIPARIASALWQAYVTTKSEGCGCS